MFLLFDGVVVAIIGAWPNIRTDNGTIKSSFLTSHITLFIFIIVGLIEGTGHWVIVPWTYYCFIVFLMIKSFNF